MATDDQAHDYHFFVSKIAFFALLKLTYIFIKYNLVSKYVLLHILRKSMQHYNDLPKFYLHHEQKILSLIDLQNLNIVYLM